MSSMLVLGGAAYALVTPQPAWIKTIAWLGVALVAFSIVVTLVAIRKGSS